MTKPVASKNRNFCGAVFLSLIFSAAAPASAPTEVTAVKKSVDNCFVTIVSRRKTEETSEQNFQFQVKSKKECEKTAKHHETNFAPHVVKDKKVTWKFVKP